MPVSFLQFAPIERYRPRWFARPLFYVPAGILLLLLIAVAIYFLYLYSTLQAQAAAFDLTQLEQMESASVILDRNDKIFGQIYVENRETIAYDQLPADLINAVVATEDNKFYQHSGYDLLGIARAALKNAAAGHVRQGASTITQQLARNSFELKGKTVRRKLLEILLARRIEAQFGKQKIMELYLNRVYFGGGLYGAEAAARGYFDKPAREMSLAECATLAGLLKSPNKLSPWTDRAASREARNFVLNRMRELGFIDAVKWQSTQSEPLVIGNRQNARGQNYAIDYIRQQVIAAVGWDRAMSDGFRIHTTVDATLQNIAEKSLRAHLDEAERHPGYDHQTYEQYAALLRDFRPANSSPNEKKPPPPEYLQGAVIALDNSSGGIVALVGGRDFEHNEFDRALQAKRPPGTAMKPFVYAAAFEKGLFPGSIVEDSALDNRTVMIGGTTGILGEWGPEREDNQYEGPITAREALAKSKNGASVRIGTSAGLDRVTEICRAAGVQSKLRQYPSTFLGSSEMTPAELCLAYTIFPNDGWRPDSPHILERVEDKNGKVVWQAPQDKNNQTVLKPAIAYEVNSCLIDALNSGTGEAASTKFGLKKFPAAGKTGTAYDFTDALFAGYDSALTCVVWAGFDKPQKIYRGAFGSEIALPVWVEVMNASLENYAPHQFAKPAGLKKVEICSKSGLLATDKCYENERNVTGETVRRRTTYIELATPEQMPTESCNVHGESVSHQLVQEFEGSQWPRAALAVDTNQVSPVMMQAPTLLADDDPYGAVKSTFKAKTVEKPAEEATGGFPDPTKPVLKAQAVQPEEKPVEVRRAQPVRPIDEVPDETILKSEPPAPIQFGDND